MPMSPSVLPLTSRSRPATSPETTVVLFHEASFSVVDTTYFGRPLMNSENGTSALCCGQ